MPRRPTKFRLILGGRVHSHHYTASACKRAGAGKGTIERRCGRLWIPLTANQLDLTVEAEGRRMFAAVCEIGANR